MLNCCNFQLGKMQQFELGKWLRNRYIGFLPEQYSERDIYIRSTDVDRTLMSAEVNLAGLYPPEGIQVWDPDLKWQPVPIHTIPENEDPVLATKKPCPKYDLLLKKLQNTEQFKNINHQLHDLYAYLTRYSGTTISSVEDVEFLYNTLFIETIYNYTLPNWTKPIFPEKLKPWAAFSFAVDCYTKDLARLKMGPLLNQIQEHFFNKTSTIKHRKTLTPKFWVYSAHDITIANILQSLGAFEYHSPPYTSTIVFELRSNSQGQFVNLYYKNTSVAREIVLEGCKFDCPLNEFVSLLKPITLNVKQWEKECKMSLLSYMPLDDVRYVFVLCGGVVVLLLLVAIVVIMQRRKSRDNVYLRLPDDVDA